MKRLLFILIILSSCREIYNPPVSKNQLNYLVVEGNITSGDTTIITLSRTNLVSDTSQFTPEDNASVNVESNTGDSYALQSIGNGQYEAPALQLNNSNTYRLAIQTVNGYNYASDYVPVLQTPPMDSISYNRDNEGNIEVYVNTHDPQNNTHYYRWEFTETWEHDAKYESTLIYQKETNTVRSRNFDEDIYRCWSIVSPSSIFIASSAGLSSDIIYKEPLVQIPFANKKLDFVYSILVKQYALTKEGFQFWENLKKNTESLGSIFDPQPSSDTGNIHCLTNPSIPVIGFVTASSVQQLRKYIYRDDIGNWPLSFPECQDRIVPPIPDTLKEAFSAFFLIPVHYENGLSIFASQPDCVDCRVEGGSTIKPPYMP